MSGTAAASAARRRIDQQELDAICARHDRLWQAKPGGAHHSLHEKLQWGSMEHPPNVAIPT